MDISLLLFLLLASHGLTNILVNAKIFDIWKIRPIIEKYEFTKILFKCSMCLGWWVGLLIAIIYLPLYYIIPFAFAASGICFLFERFSILLDTLNILLDDLYDFLNSDEK